MGSGGELKTPIEYVLSLPWLSYILCWLPLLTVEGVKGMIGKVGRYMIKLTRIGDVILNL